MRWTLFLPLIGFIALVIAFADGLTRDPSHIPSVLIDRPAPEFDLPPVTGLGTEGLSTADLKRGEPVLVNFFASWCPPCRVEHPILERLAKQEGVTVYGLNYKDEAEDAAQFINALGNPFTRLGADHKGRTGIDFGISGVPETFIIRGDGRIAYRHAGPLSPADMEDKILPILRQLRTGE